jgi:hypothetical protein
MGNVKRYELGKNLSRSELIGQWDQTDAKLQRLKELNFNRDKIEFEDALDRLLRYCPSSVALDETGTDELFSITDSPNMENFAEPCLRGSARMVERVYTECMIPDQCRDAIEELFRFSAIAILDEKVSEIYIKLRGLREAQSFCSTDEADEESGKSLKQIRALEHEADRIETARLALSGSFCNIVDILCTNVVEEEAD